MPRIDKLTSPPEVGKRYLVPAIRFKWKSAFFDNPAEYGIWWPVIGELHDDVEFFDFKHKHYHVDPRFLTPRHWSDLAYSETPMLTLLATPLNHTQWPDGPPDPTYRRMKCSARVVDYEAAIKQFTNRETGQKQYPNPRTTAIRCAYKGVQCRRDKQGWVCPHRLAPLGSVAPISGVVTCFLHGLRIDAKTGICL